MKTVIEMAKECGFVTGPYGIGVPPSRSINDMTDAPWMLEALERFAELVRADERARMEEQPAQQQEPQSMVLNAAMGYIMRHTPKLVHDEICKALRRSHPSKEQQ